MNHRIQYLCVKLFPLILVLAPRTPAPKHSTKECIFHAFLITASDIVFFFFQLGGLVEGLQALLLKDKAWVRAALGLLRKTVCGDCAGGRVTPPDGAGIGANDQRRQLLGFDLGRSVGLELAPSIQMLAELSLCSQGEEVREGSSFASEQFARL